MKHALAWSGRVMGPAERQARVGVRVYSNWNILITARFSARLGSESHVDTRRITCPRFVGEDTSPPSKAEPLRWPGLWLW